MLSLQSNCHPKPLRRRRSGVFFFPMLLKTLIARAFVWASKSLSQSKRSPTRFNWGYESFVAGLYHGDFHHLTWDVYPSSVPLFFRCGEVGIPTQSWSCFNGRTLDGLWTPRYYGTRVPFDESMSIGSKMKQRSNLKHQPRKRRRVIRAFFF